MVSSFPAEPEIEVSPESVDVLKNGNATLNCSARGDPTPNITWLHNEQPVDTSGGRIMVRGDGSLFIQMVLLTDMGAYECVATNLLGSVSSDTAVLMVDGQLSLVPARIADSAYPFVP